MKKILGSLTLVAGFVFSNAQTNNFSQIDYITNGLTTYDNTINSGSARYVGMGGATGALGGDISSVDQNPAGLGVAIASEMTFTAGVDSWNTKSKFANSTKANDSEFNVNHFGGSFVFSNDGSKWNRFSLGLNYIRQNLDNTERTGRNENIGFNVTDDAGNITNTYIFDQYVKSFSGYKDKFSVDFATSYDDKIYLGASVNFHSSSFDNYTQYAETNNQNERYVYNQDGTPYREDATGVSLSVGIIGKVNQNLRLGAAYHSPIWYNDIEQSFYAAQYNDDGSVYSYDLYRSNYDLTTGGKLVGSAALVLGKSFALDFDYTYHMNSSIKLKPTYAFNSANAVADDFVKNSSEFRVGGEYRIDKFRLRAGYNFVGTPYDSFNNLNVVDENGQATTKSYDQLLIGDINRFSGGVGYDFGGFYLDFAYQHQNTSYNTVLGGATYVDGYNYAVDLQDNYTPKIKRNSDLFLLTAGWRF